MSMSLIESAVERRLFVVVMVDYSELRKSVDSCREFKVVRRSVCISSVRGAN